MLVLILNIVGPVFLVLLAGFSAVKLKLLSDTAINGLMRFATHIAVPCLLFRATSSIDLATAYDWRLMLAYFGTAIICFMMTMVVARKMYGRRPGEAVAVSFGNLFLNLILMGTPIVDRAFGADALTYVVALISLNAAICYLVGISTMETVRVDGRGFSQTVVVVTNAMFRNSFTIGIALGFLVNISGQELPVMFVDFIDMLKSAAIPCALFALGGVLTRYSLSDELSEASSYSVISLLLQPVLAYFICSLLGLDGMARNVVVLMSAMPAGIHAYLFASLYSRGMGTAANSVLLATMVSVFSVSAWLWVLVGVN